MPQISLEGHQIYTSTVLYGNVSEETHRFSDRTMIAELNSRTRCEATPNRRSTPRFERVGKINPTPVNMLTHIHPHPIKPDKW